MQDLLIDLCFEHVVSFHVVGNIFMIELPGIDKVLSGLPAEWWILGLCAFTINGYSVDVMPEFNPDLGEGISVTEALAIIAGWPRDWNLWIELTLTELPPRWPTRVNEL